MGLTIHYQLAATGDEAHYHSGTKGGKAGRGPAKARTREQAQVAAAARWKKVESHENLHNQTSRSLADDERAQADAEANAACRCAAA